MSLVKKEFRYQKGISAIVGDIVGSRFEFNNIKTKDFELLTQESRFTDDSVLTIAVMDFLMRAKNHLDSKEAASYLQKWARKYPYAGYGGMFYEWKDMDDPKPYNSYGNGAAMRISPVAFYFDDYKDVEMVTNVVTSVTHNHKEGLKGAQAINKLIFMAREGATKEELYNEAINFYPEIANMSYEELVKNNYHGEEICQIALPQALYCFFISKDYEDCLRTVVSIGGDTDTLAAIAMPLAEEYYNEEIPWVIQEVLGKVKEDMREIMREFFKELDRKEREREKEDEN